MPREAGPKEIEAFLERTRRLTRRQVLTGAAGVAAAAALTKVVLAQAPPAPPPTLPRSRALWPRPGGRPPPSRISSGFL